MRIWQKALLLILVLQFAFPTLTYAHFGTVLPENPILTSQRKETSITFSFIHPFEQKGMDLEKPEKVAIKYLGSEACQEVTSDLKQIELLNHKAWQTKFKPQKTI